MLKDYYNEVLRANFSDSSSDDEGTNKEETEMLDYEHYLQEFDSLQKARCLFCKVESCVTEDIWQHMKEIHSFDFSRETLGKNEYEKIRLINFLRGCTKKGLDPKNEYMQITEESSLWKDDSLLNPVIEDDRLILELDLLNEECTVQDVPGHPEVISELSLERENEILKEKIAILSEIISQLQVKEIELETKRDPNPSPYSKISTTSEQNSGTSISPHELSRKLFDLSERESTSEDQSPDFRRDIGTSRQSSQDNPYFSSYSTLDIHREMILDKVRTDAYYNFITHPDNSSNIFKDKVVLDVGTGTGILSLFALQAGARMVVGVDAAKETIKVAENIAEVNGMSKDLHFIFGKLEDLSIFISDNKVVSVYKDELPPKDAVPFKCDIIISEWMGYCLLYESMLYTILNARDKYLKAENGVFSGEIFPSSVRLELSLADYSDVIQGQLSPWLDNKMYNLDLSQVSPKLPQLLSVPYVEIVPIERIRCKEVIYLPSLSILDISKEELASLRQPFKVEAPKDGSFFTSLVISFNAVFDSKVNTSFKVIMETSPFCEPTHWKQTILHLKSPENQLLKVVGDLSGFITITPRIDNFRHISIVLELLDVKTADKKVYPRLLSHYSMT
ncbi:arginine N-methyltransferase [Cryptosporidium felis]|nr:arginine N-methyltransferase [Cryptosporidium felis]